jgi:hypothetical protein
MSTLVIVVKKNLIDLKTLAAFSKKKFKKI